ncbi:MAG TPA: Spy/CpxP family protein refolding chaperone [Gemmatimonadota bacterium]|nr:Spy/CpxP family protein refolding chaperone [Gemmatimonadota bacterium]
MNIRVNALAALALAALLAVPALGVAQEADQDAATTHRMHRGMMREAGEAGHMQMGRGMRQGMRMGGGHLGPHFLIGLKDELELSGEQVAQLEGIHESHYALMTGMREQMEKGHEALMEARKADDYGAMESAIDELARLRTAQAKSFIDVERQTMGVLTDAQRQQFETWKEGAQLFRRHGMQRMRMHMEGGAEGQRMQMRERMHQPGGSR